MADKTADTKRADAKKTDEAPDPDALYDLVGKDGRRIHRAVALDYARSEKARIEALTGGAEKLKVEASSEFPLGGGPTVIPDPADGEGRVRSTDTM